MPQMLNGGRVTDIISRVAGPGARLSLDVRAYVASTAQDVRAETSSIDGPDATSRALARSMSGTVDALAVAGDGTNTWAELARKSDDGEIETCLLGLRHDGEGMIQRVIWQAVPHVEGFRAAAGDERPPARGLFEAYFTALQDARFGAAADGYAADVIWSHPPYQSAPVRELARGRPALLDTLVNRRGANPVRQIISGFWQSGSQVFLEGIIEGIPNGGSFTGLAQLNSDAEIARYVAFYSAERYGFAEN